MQKRVDFGFETTLAGRGHLNLFRRFNDYGYRITIFFLLVPNAEASLARIRARVIRGGHDVPESDVRRRFDRSIRNFLSNYRQLADSWFLFDNEGATPELIATWDDRQLHIIETDIYRALEDRYVRQV